MKKVQAKTEVELMATHSSRSSEAFEACRLFVLLTGEWTLIKPLISLFLKLITSRQLMLKEALRSFWGIFFSAAFHFFVAYGCIQGST